MMSELNEFQVEQQLEAWVGKVSDEAREKFEASEAEKAKEYMGQRLDALVEEWSASLTETEDRHLLWYRWRLLKAGEVEQAFKFFEGQVKVDEAGQKIVIVNVIEEERKPITITATVTEEERKPRQIFVKTYKPPQ